MKLGLPNLNAAGIAHYSALQKILHGLLGLLAETEKRSGELDMDKLKEMLSAEIVDMDDIKIRERKSVWFDTIVKVVESIPDGRGRRFPPSVIQYTHLQSIVTRMKKKKLLPDNIRVVKEGDNSCLVKSKK